MTTEKRHIYHVLNTFNEYFGEKPKQIAIHSVDSSHLYVEMTYDDVQITETNDWCDNKEFHTGKNRAMARIEIRHDIDNKPLFVLRGDGLYINPYTMPEKTKAEKFYKALDLFILNEYDEKFRFAVTQPVTLSNKMINQTIDKCLREVKILQNEIKDLQNINELADHTQRLTATIRSLNILKDYSQTISKPTRKCYFTDCKFCKNNICVQKDGGGIAYGMDRVSRIKHEMQSDEVKQYCRCCIPDLGQYKKG